MLMYSTGWIDQLQKRFGRYAIRNLMTIVVGGMGIVFLLDTLLGSLTGFSVSSLLTFNRRAILRGQVWRLVTFAFIPPNTSPLMIIFSLYFYWMIGSALENQWGSFKFNLYYLFGIIGTILSGFITGYASNTYLNLSLFLGFAMMYPDYQVNLFFFLPVKMKYLALIDAIGLLIAFFQVGFGGKIALLVAIANVLMFFWNDMKTQVQNWYRRYQWKKNFR